MKKSKNIIMWELKEYIKELETKINILEIQNQQLEKKVTKNEKQRIEG